MNEDAYDLYRQGNRLFDQGNFNAAIARWEQAVIVARRDRRTEVELYSLAHLPTAWANLGDYQQMVVAATRLLARARELSNDEFELRAALRLATAIGYVDVRGRWQEIRTLLLDGLTKARQLREEYYEIYHLARLGSFALMIDEEASFSWLQEALNVLKTSQLDASGSTFFRSDICYSLSELMQRRDENAEALRYAEMALGAAKEHGNRGFLVHRYRRVAEVQRWRGELGEALEHCEEAYLLARQLQIVVDLVETLALKVRLLMDLGLRERAEVTYRELKALDVEQPQSYYKLGKCAYEALSDLEEAEHAFRKSLELRPKDAGTWTALGFVLYDKDEIGEAVRCWRESLKLRNENAEALAGLALGLWTQGQRDEAVKFYQQALELQARYADLGWLSRYDVAWSSKAIEAVRPLVTAAQAT
jgi:tetratricopeptide (TPR) repeat protein